MRNQRLAPYLFLLPFGVLFVVFFIFPFLYSVYLSLFVSRMGVSSFVGLHNYVIAFHDGSFWGSMRTVGYFAITTIVLQMFLAIVLTLLLDSPFVKGKSFFRLLYFLPYAVPGVIAGLMWGFLYSPELDPLLNLFKGLNGGKAVSLLSGGHFMPLIVNIVLWEATGYTMTILYANLTSIPTELYEAAKMDGCSEWSLALKIKLPLLRPTIVLLLVLALIGSTQLFNEPYVLSSLTAVPYNFTPNMDIYNTAFSYNNFNYSATMATILALIATVASVIFMYATSGEEREQKRLRKAVKKNGLYTTEVTQTV